MRQMTNREDLGEGGHGCLEIFMLYVVSDVKLSPYPGTPVNYPLLITALGVGSICFQEGLICQELSPAWFKHDQRTGAPLVLPGTYQMQ